MLAPLAIYFLQAYLLAAVITIFKKKWVKVVIYVMLFAFCFLKIFLKEQFGMQINPLIITILAETNVRESTEFVESYLFGIPMLKTLLQLLIYAVIIIIMEKGYTRFHLRSSKPGKKGLVVLDILTIALLVSGVFWTGMFNQGLKILIKTGTQPSDSVLFLTFDPFTKTAYTYQLLAETSNSMKEEAQVTKNMTETPSSVFSDDSLNVVLVIGESYIKEHAQIYGYDIPTTPNMVKERDRGNLVAFTDVCTPYAHTTEAVRNMLCTNDIAQGEKWNKTPFVPAIFKRAGYKVFMWDNQLTFDKDVYDFTLGSFLYNDEIKKLSYDQHNDKPYQYDGELITSFKNAKKVPAKKNFVIFHLMGQHLDATERYPNTKENNKFTADDIPVRKPWFNKYRRRIVANYDNATLYNDRVMMGIFNLFRNTNTVVIYVPDHGEEVYDWRKIAGRIAEGMCADLLKYQYEVPFIVWFSDKYKALHPDVVASLKSGAGHAFETDNTCQVLFHVAGLKTRYYKADRDPASPKYVKPKRIVCDDIDYDAMRFGKK